MHRQCQKVLHNQPILETDTPQKIIDFYVSSLESHVYHDFLLVDDVNFFTLTVYIS